MHKPCSDSSSDSSQPFSSYCVYFSGLPGMFFTVVDIRKGCAIQNPVRTNVLEEPFAAHCVANIQGDGGAAAKLNRMLQESGPHRGSFPSLQGKIAP